KAARQSVVWAMGLIGSFYIMTTFLGFGAATLVGKTKICATVTAGCKPNSNLAAPRLAEYLGTQFFGGTGGEFLLAFIAAVAFAIASAANLPAILFTLFWKRFNTWGAVASLVGGTLVTIWLVAIGPGWTVPVNEHPAFPLQNVGIVSIPIGFALAIIGTYLGELVKADKLAEVKFHEIDVRAQTGLGAEPNPVPA